MFLWSLIAAGQSSVHTAERALEMYTGLTNITPSLPAVEKSPHLP